MYFLKIWKETKFVLKKRVRAHAGNSVILSNFLLYDKKSSKQLILVTLNLLSMS